MSEVRAIQFNGQDLPEGADWDMGGTWVTLPDKTRKYIMPGDWLIGEGGHYSEVLNNSEFNEKYSVEVVIKHKTNNYMTENVPMTAPTTGLSFEAALRALKDGRKLQRAGWNGPNQFVVMMPPLYLPPYNTQGTERKVNDRTAKWIGEDQPLDCQPYIALYNAQKKWQPGWLPSQGDLFADDWQIID